MAKARTKKAKIRAGAKRGDFRWNGREWVWRKFKPVRGFVDPRNMTARFSHTPVWHTEDYTRTQHIRVAVVDTRHYKIVPLTTKPKARR